MSLILGCQAGIEDTDPLDADRGAKADGPLEGSCVESCGEQSSTGNCWCDEACKRFGDCCADKASVCDPDPCDTGDPNQSMVLVETQGQRWCVDRYEAVACDANRSANPNQFRASCVSLSSGNNGVLHGDESTSILPSIVSRTGAVLVPGYRAYAFAGIHPTRLINFHQSRALCAAAGKVLIPNPLWSRAAEGTPVPGDNNGRFNPRCNTGVHGLLDGTTGFRVTGRAGAFGPDGNHCVSRWGAEDMIGNFWEITEGAGAVPHYRSGSAFWGSQATLALDLVAPALEARSAVSFRCARRL